MYEIRSKKLFIPASNSKVITTAVALKYLGPNYRFSTQIYTDGILENQVLKGNLYIKGSFLSKKVKAYLMALLKIRLITYPAPELLGS